MNLHLAFAIEKFSKNKTETIAVFIKKLAKLGKPLIISTGMHDIEDIKEIIKICNESQCNEISLLHCVSSYPTPYDQVNLRAMNHISSVFNGPVGYSDHTEDHMASLAAVAMGAKIIERHITIERNIPNAQDWRVSSGPENFPSLILFGIKLGDIIYR